MKEFTSLRDSRVLIITYTRKIPAKSETPSCFLSFQFGPSQNADVNDLFISYVAMNILSIAFGLF